MVGCGRVEKLLSSYLEKGLEEGLQEELQEHIRFCTDCLEKEKALRKLLGLTKDLPEHEPSEGFLAGFRRKLDAERFRVSPRKKAFGIRKLVWGVPVVTALVALIIVLNLPQKEQVSELASEQVTQSSGIPSQEQSTEPVTQPSEQENIQEAPVEFVLDNWNQTVWENFNNLNQQAGSNQYFSGQGRAFRFQTQDRPVRVYVMPVVQNQMAGYQTRQPY